MTPTIELTQAVHKYKSGNSRAFEALYQESSKYVYACIYKVMCGNDNAQDAICDIMQDTYVEISRYISALEDESKFLSWAGTIATRKCYAYLKQNHKYILLEEEDKTFEQLADDEKLIPEEIMQDKEKQRLIREIIHTQLTEMQKICIISYYYNGQKQSEIAQELGIPENTVKTNLSRAKAKIKESVLDLEKNKGTRLYSMTPFLLLLFREEILSIEVPKNVSKSVLSKVNGGSPSGLKRLCKKIAEASVKSKVISGMIGVGVIGATLAIGGMIAGADAKDNSKTDRREEREENTDGKYTEDTKENTTEEIKEEVNEEIKEEVSEWVQDYKEYLLSKEGAVGFDLHDFDENGIPELMVKLEDGNIVVCHFVENAVEEIEELVSSASVTKEEAGMDQSMECRYGYGEIANSIIEIDDWCGEYNGQMYQMETAVIYQYLFGEIKQTYAIAPAFTGTADNISVGYYLVDSSKEELVSLERGKVSVANQKAMFREIEYTAMEAEKIDIRFMEYQNTEDK